MEKDASEIAVRRGEKVVSGGGGDGDTRATVIGGKYWSQNYKEDSRPATARVVPQLI